MIFWKKITIWQIQQDFQWGNKTYKNEFIMVGINPEVLGTRYIQKGAAMYVHI